MLTYIIMSMSFRLRSAWNGRRIGSPIISILAVRQSCLRFILALELFFFIGTLAFKMEDVANFILNWQVQFLLFSSFFLNLAHQLWISCNFTTLTFLQKVQHELLSVYANQLLEKEHSGCHALLRDDKVVISILMSMFEFLAIINIIMMIFLGRWFIKDV